MGIPELSGKAPAVPMMDAEGAVILSHGRHARGVVAAVFEMIGGADKMAEWAEENPGEFYTKLYTKIIGKEVEVQASQGVEDLLRRLDEKTIDGEFTARDE